MCYLFRFSNSNHIIWKSAVVLISFNNPKMDGAEIHDRLVSIASFFQDDFSIDWLVELTGLKVTQIIAILELEVGKKNFISRGAGIYALSGKTLEKKYSKIPVMM